MTALSLALDWTPNVNHIGFFIAEEKGYYQELGIQLEMVDPSMDNYQYTPAKKVELGMADFALCPTESIISYRTKEHPFPMIAIAAILQEDLSAIVVKNSSGIKSPKDLDGKSYSSYQARYEDGIVRQMIKNDGGQGSIKIDYPSKLGIWDTVINGPFDATWIFLNWEGIEAEKLDIKLSYFKMKDYGIPYSYSPVIATGERNIGEKRVAYSHFLKATKMGYLYARKNSKEAVALFEKYIPENDQSIDLLKALEVSRAHFGNEQDWGRLDERKVNEFLHWIKEHELESRLLVSSELITNELIS